MRLSVLAAAAFVALSGVAFAQSYDTPEALLEAFYAPYLDNEIPENQEAFFSDTLNGLYAADAENTPEGEMGAIEFDPFIDGQDWTLADFAVGDADIEGNSATVDVTFTNFGQPTVLTYDLVRENGSWLIDDVSDDNGEFPYRLSDIFENAQN